MEALDALAKELGYPGAEKLYKASQRRGLGIKRNLVDAYVRNQGQRQVFLPRPKYKGTIVATGIKDRFAADLIDYSTRSAKGYLYILVAQDIFSRKIYAVAMKDKTPQTTTEAFESIVRSSGVPRLLDTDDGAEFKTAFEEYLQEENIEHQIADPRNKNARGTLDSAIRSVKQILARLQVAEGTRDWASLVPRAVHAYNETEHGSLIGRNPNDIGTDDDAKFLLKERAAEGIQKNTQEIEDRGKRFDRIGGFRAELPNQGRGFERGFKPRYSDEVRPVREVVGGTIISNGQAFSTRHALAVPVGSTATVAEDLRSGNPDLDNQRKEALEQYKASIAAFIGDNGKWEFEVAAHMKTLGMAAMMTRGLNYRKALLLLGFHVASSTLVTKTPVAPAAARANIIARAA